jgi:hypothetical protein
MSFFGGSSTTRTTQTTKGTPEQEAQFQDYFNILQGLTNQGAPQYFPDNTVAGLSPEQIAARQAGMNFAQGGAQDIYAGLMGAGGTANQFMQNAFADPTTQPGFQNVVNYLQTRSNQNLSENVLPAIESGSIINGMMGGSGGDRTKALAAGRSQEGLDGTIGQMLMQAYGQNQSNAMNAMGMMPGLAGAQMQAGLAPMNIMEQIGGANRDLDQSLINAAIDRWNFEQTAPYQHLGNIQGLQGNVGQYGGTTQTTQKTKTPFSLNQALGAGLGIASMFTPAGPALAGLGAGLGSAAPQFGSALGAASGFGPLPMGANSIWSNANLFPGLKLPGGG